jgi:hypothetical protein
VLKDDDNDDTEEKWHAHRIAIPAPASAVVTESKDDLPPALCTVRAMLRDIFHQPAKDLEAYSPFSATCFDISLGMTVVPPQLCVSSSRVWSGVRHAMG